MLAGRGEARPARLRERPGLPEELAGDGRAHVGAQQAFAIHLVVHVHADQRMRIARERRQLSHQRALARACACIA
jgi:hypothetical protein